MNGRNVIRAAPPEWRCSFLLIPRDGSGAVRQCKRTAEVDGLCVQHAKMQMRAGPEPIPSRQGDGAATA